MKKNYLSIFILLLFYSNTMSQSVNLSWGPQRKSAKDVTDLGFTGQADGHFYTVALDKKVIVLSKHRQDNMSKVFDQSISFNDSKRNNNDKNLTFAGMKLFKNNFVLLAKDIDRKKDVQIVYGQKVSVDGIAEGEFVKLDERETGRRSKDGSFQIEYANDSSTFLIVKHPNYDKYADEKFIFKIFNSDLKTLYNLQVELPYKDKDFSVAEINLSKSHVIYMLAKIVIPKEDKKKDEARHYYQVISIDAQNGGAVQVYDLKLNGKYIDEVTMRLDNKEDVRCLGFYSDLTESGKPKPGINGLFYFGVNVLTKKVENTSIKEFSKAVVEELAGKKRANKDKGLTSSFKLKYFFDKPDGTSIALVEEDFVHAVTTTYRTANGATTTTTTYYYHNNEILAIYIDAKGNILQYVTIPKSQVSVNDNGRYNSFYATVTDNKTYIVYNDDKENALKNDFTNTMRNIKKAQPVVIIINDGGKYEKKNLSDPKSKVEFVLIPKQTDRISTNSAMFYSETLGKGFCCIFGQNSGSERFGLMEIK